MNRHPPGTLCQIRAPDNPYHGQLCVVVGSVDHPDGVWRERPPGTWPAGDYLGQWAYVVDVDGAEHSGRVPQYAPAWAVGFWAYSDRELVPLPPPPEVGRAIETHNQGRE